MPESRSPGPAAAPSGDGAHVHVKLEGVTKKFGTVPAVNGISLEIPRGAFATLLGPSGCGKTTLLRLIAGFYEPDEGNIYLSDRLLNKTPAHLRGTAMVFQDYALFPHMTVYDNVAYGLRLAGLRRTETEERTVETLAFVGLRGLNHRWPNELSGGQQQRVALARALVVRPEVLLLDEPLSNLDAKLRERMRWELRALQRRLNMTFVYVTHDQEEALAMSDWIAVINSGQVEQWGAPWDIYYRPKTPFLADFVGAVNLVTAPIVESDDWSIVVAIDKQRLTLPAQPTPARNEVLLCIRPESLSLGSTRPTPSSISMPGRVIRQAFLGNLMRYWVQVGAFEWIVDHPDPGAGTRTSVTDQDVVLWLNPARVHVIAADSAAA